MNTLRHIKVSYPIDLVFLMAFCYIVPFIDAANGFMILAGDGAGSAGTIGQLFKACILVLGWYLIKNKKIIVIYLGVYLLIMELIGFLLHESLGYFLIGFAFAFKIIFAAVIYFFTVEMFAKYGVDKILRIFRNSAIIYALIFFLSIALGLSYSTYQEGNFGSKGLFASGNALSIYFGSMSLIGLYIFSLSRRRLDLFLSGFLMISALFVGTKTSILFISLYFFLLFYTVSYFYKLLLLIFLVVLSLSFYDLFGLFFDVIVHRFENSDSISSFLASSRDVFVINALSNFYTEGFYVLRLVFGLGVYMSFRALSDDISLYDTLENDIFDIFFSYGFIGLFVYISFYLVHVFRAIMFKNFEALVIFSSMFFLSALIGHVLFDAMAVIPLVLSAALTTIKLRNTFEKDCIRSFVK
jgi:hypothetical protein